MLRSSSGFVPPGSLGVRAVSLSPTTTTTPRHLFTKLFSSASTGKYPIIADEEVMSTKAHGTSEKPVQKNLRWKCDYDTADRICNFSKFGNDFGVIFSKHSSTDDSLFL
jgi:hypothetical protein